MKRIHTLLFLLVFLIISCPPQRVQEPGQLPESILIKKAREVYHHHPLLAYDLLKNIEEEKYQLEKNLILFEIYYDQREYKRAETLLDSLFVYKTDFNSHLAKKVNMVLLKNNSWEKSFKFTNDPFIKGISAYHLSRYEEALNLFLSSNKEPPDYRILYIAKTLKNMGKRDEALKFLLTTDSISPYLTMEYQNILSELLLNTNDPEFIKKELPRIKNEELSDYLWLKIYELKKDLKSLNRKAWNLIKKSPKSIGARYALSIIKPKTKTEYKFLGRAYYLLGNFESALKYLNKATHDDEVEYYLGKIYYDKGSMGLALKYLIGSNLAPAYYYRARIYENQGDYKMAIELYDSLIHLYSASKYATNARRRMAFLYEDIGDTLMAIKTFLGIREKNTDLRAGIRLFRRGSLSEAVEIFKKYNEPEFIYWQIKTKERLGENTDSLNNYLVKNYPLSYYTLIRNNAPLLFDTTSVITWLSNFGDTAISFDYNDTLHLNKALRYFEIDEVSYALSELGMIEDNSLLDLFHLSTICEENGADWAAIRYCLKIKSKIEKSTQIYPIGFLRKLYPVRHLFTILNCSSEIELLLAMMWQESLFDPNAVSKSNAQGLLQILPSTGRTIAQEMGITEYSLFDPKVSIKFGSHYLNKMLNDFNSLPLALAAYNAGPAKVKKWIKKNLNSEIDEFIELIPYAETRDYIRLIAARKKIYETIWRGIISS